MIRNENDKIIGYEEASVFLGIPKGTLYAYVSDRRIPHYRLGPRSVKFSLNELETWLNNYKIIMSSEGY